MRKQMGDDIVVKAITKHLADLMSVLNLEKPMNQQQIILCAGDIMTRFYWLKVPEIAECFSQIRSGALGVVRYSINGTEICQMLEKFSNGLTESRANKSKTESDEAKNLYQVVQTGPVYEALKSVAEKLKAETKSNRELVRSKQHSQDEFIQWAIRQFDRRYQKAGKECTPRLIRAYGDTFDQTAWVNYKLEQMARVKSKTA